MTNYDEHRVRAFLLEVLRRIVAIARPGKIILFGSAARGEAGSDSDIDLLVIKSGVEHRGRLVEKIYRNLYGIFIVKGR